MIGVFSCSKVRGGVVGASGFCFLLFLSSTFIGILGTFGNLASATENKI